MAGKNIKGVNLEIGGSTTKFNKAMKDMSSVTKTTQKELDAVNKSLKFDPKNVDLLKQKEELLAKQIEDVRVKVDKMKAAKEKADKEMAKGTEVNQEQYRQLVREISAAEGHLKSLEKQNKEVRKSANKTSEVLGNIGKGALPVVGAIVGVGTAAVGAMSAAAEETREYREDMNKLETAFKTGGFTVDAAKKSYEGFYAVLGETDRSVEAVNHLARFVATEQDLAKWSDIAAGVTATFGDSLPIEGLTEAANETAKVGKVTGVLADALNWAGNNEDEFNEKLAKCNSEKERAQLITKTLDESYQESAKTYKELNSDIIANRKATSEANDHMAKLGESSEGVNTKLKEAKNTITAAMLPTIGKFADKISELDEGQIMLLGSIGAVGVAVPAVVSGIGQMITAVGVIKGAYDKLTISATAASVVTKAIPFIGVAAGAIALVGALSAVASATDEEIRKTNELHEANKQRYEDYQKNKQAAQEQAEASLSEMTHIQNLKDELISLADENGKVAESDKARAEFILGQLNNALGTEYSMTGLIIGNYKDLSVAIDNLITKKKAEILLSSKEDSYKTAVQNIKSAADAVKELKAAYEEANRAYRNAELFDMPEAQVHYYQVKMQEASKAYGEAIKLHNQYNKAIVDYEETYLSILKDGGKKIVEEFEKTAGIAAEKGAETAENFNEGMKGVDVQTPAKVVGQTSVKALGDGTERDNEGNTPKSLGESVVDGLIEGFESKMPILQIRSQQMGQKVIAALKSKEGLDVNSPSKPAIPVGAAISEGLAVGIEKDMSAEEALEKKCSNLKKILSDFTSDFKADIEIAESEYDLWKSENPNANDEIKRSKEREMLVKTATGQDSTVKAINDALWILGETAGTGSVEYKNLLADLNKAKKDLSETNAKIADIDRYLPQMYSEGNVALAESQYILWKARNPEASEHENLIQQEKKLNTEYEEQGKKVKDLNDELYISNQLYGESSEESKKLLAQLNKEIAAYEELGRQIAGVNEQKSQYTSLNGKLSSGERSPASAYAAYHVQYGALLKSEGMSQDAIDAAARKVSGYAGQQSISITNNNYGVTPDTAYEVSKGTQKTMNNFAMQGVL